jgi:hypothetical protein
VADVANGFALLAFEVITHAFGCRQELTPRQGDWREVAAAVDHFSTGYHWHAAFVLAIEGPSPWEIGAGNPN